MLRSYWEKVWNMEWSQTINWLSPADIKDEGGRMKDEDSSAAPSSLGAQRAPHNSSFSKWPAGHDEYTISSLTMTHNGNGMADFAEAQPDGKVRRQAGAGRQSDRGPHIGDIIQLKLLVITGESKDPNFLAITSVLDYLGAPYDILRAHDETLTQPQLWHGISANYQGIILSIGNAGRWNPELMTWESQFEESEWETLHTYRTRFGVRQLALFCPPGVDLPTTNLRLASYSAPAAPHGVSDTPDGDGDDGDDEASGDPAFVDLSLTEAGREVFDYLDPTCTIPCFGLGACLEHAADDVAITPLLVTPDGKTVAAIYVDAVGNEQLVLSAAHTADLLHTQLLSYGLVNWTTRGLFLGARRIYLNVQIDDIFNQNRLWNMESQSGEDGEIYRLGEDDIEAVVQWLDKMHSHPLVDRAFTFDFAFNGGGIQQPSDSDLLVQSLTQRQHYFRWINHGFTHLHLGSATMEECFAEIQQNHLAALLLGLDAYHTDSMVTSNTSGLDNYQFLVAAKSLGVRYLVSDTSRPGWDNPAPNVGNRSKLQPEILVIPRHPSNLLHDVSTPDEWVSRYNHIYRSYWGRDFSYEEILAQEAGMLLRYMLKFDLDPSMFHQANLRAYDGTHSLLTDLIDCALREYEQYIANAPVSSLSMHEIGDRMAMGALCNIANIKASLFIGNGLIITADREITLAVTGLHVEGASEVYAGQHISTIALKAGEAYRVPAVNVIGYDVGLKSQGE